jgi:hypothetical protein
MVSVDVQPTMGPRTIPKTARDRAPVTAETGGQDPAAGDDDADRDGHVDQEDPAPIEAGGQDTTEEDAGGAAGRSRGAIQRKRLGQLAGVMREEGHEHGECCRRDQGRSDTLDGAAREEDGVGPGETGKERRPAQDGEADHEHAASPVEVGETAAEQEETAEGDDVGVEDPGEIGL